MIPLASRRISPGWSCPVAQAAWCGNNRLIRTSPGYGALESMPPDTDNPKPLGPLIISTLNVQSGMIKYKRKNILNSGETVLYSFRVVRGRKIGKVLKPIFLFTQFAYMNVGQCS